MIWVLALHLVAVGGAAALGSRLGKRIFWLTAVAPLGGVIWAAAATPTILAGEALETSLPWVEGLGLSLDLRVDGFGLLMVWLVAGIGLLVMIYAVGYFSDRPGLGRFAATLVGFGGSMLGLVSADDLLLLFVFWELTSITSYLLIGFEDTNASARSAALQALLVTGLGALAMLAGIVLLGQGAGTYSLSEILSQPPAGGAVEVALALILVGAFAKSAQVPFHFWLPGAMTAPTPVSAYLHSATMVKAGIYLIARLAPGFVDTVGWWRPVVVGVGVASMLVGGWRALGQRDLKLLLAYGTVSQLGFITALVGAGSPELVFAGVAVILAHALFKASLFMVAGIVDHQTHTRDLTRLHHIGRALPWVAGLGAVASASMVGIPALAGFVAKEAALEALLHVEWMGHTVALAGVVAASALTAAYAARFVMGGFFSDAEIDDPEERVSDAPAPRFGFLVSPGVLVALTLAFGVAPVLEDELVGGAAESLAAGASSFHLAAWHGLGLPLYLSLGAIAGGLVLWRLPRLVEAARRVTSRVPSATDVYGSALVGVNRAADRLTGVVQNGSLPIYLGVLFTATVVIPGAAMLSGWRVPADLVLAEHPAQAAAVLLLVVAAVGTARAKRRLGAVVFLGGVGVGVAVLFVFQGAPDLALTQVLVESITLAVFVLVLRHLPARFEHVPWRLRGLSRVVISAAVGAFAALFALEAAASRVADPISGEFLERSLPEAHGRNVVNVILVDFRGFDTLGEITVLVVAVTGIIMLVQAGRRARARGEAEEPE